MKSRKGFLLVLVLSLFLSGCTGSNEKVVTPTEEAVEIKIAAAISLKEALEEVKTRYEQHKQVKLTYIFGGSGKLAQQIQQGAPVDVFVSANADWMDVLEKEELLVNETRTDLTGNKIVLIASKGTSIAYNSIEDINASEVRQIAVGNPESVPAGQYAEQLLNKLDKWDELNPKIVFAQDVRQVLTYVETGNVDLGFVYESDALSSDSIKILATADSGLHDPIIYPAAVLQDSKQLKEASAFVEYMASDEAQAILEKHGFKK